MVEIKVNRFSDKFLFLWGAVFLVAIITLLLIHFKIKPHGNMPVALHYNVVIGVDSFGKGSTLYAIPGVTLIIAGFNYIVYQALGPEDKFLAWLAAGMSLAVAIVLCSAVLFLLKVN